MHLNAKSLEKLRDLINEETTKRSGREIVEFFNSLGEDDIYQHGFPSRWIFTDEKLYKFNGTHLIEECIKKLFAPVNYIGKTNELKKHISDFNEYLLFDKYEILLNVTQVEIRELSDNEKNTKFNNVFNPEEQKFLETEYTIDLNNLNIESNLKIVIEHRLKEISNSIDNNLPLASIFLIGSTIEGVLYADASMNIELYNRAYSQGLTDSNRTKKLNEWSLSDLIITSYKLERITQDMYRFSEIVREYRNYIHPREQLNNKFSPDINTSIICFQVLKGVIYQLSNIKD